MDGKSRINGLLREIINKVRLIKFLSVLNYLIKIVRGSDLKRSNFFE